MGDWRLATTETKPRGDGSTPLPSPALRPASEDPAAYDADQDLLGAVNAALCLGWPLLVTGEPGAARRPWPTILPGD